MVGVVDHLVEQRADDVQDVAVEVLGAEVDLGQAIARCIFPTISAEPAYGLLCRSRLDGEDRRREDLWFKPRNGRQERTFEFRDRGLEAGSGGDAVRFALPTEAAAVLERRQVRALFAERNRRHGSKTPPRTSPS